MSAPPAPPVDPAAATPRQAITDRLHRRHPPRRRLLERVSIQSKLLLMLLMMAVLATAVVGGIGFQSGRASLREAVFDRLTSVREAQARILELGMRDLLGSLRVYVAGQTVSEAMDAFSAGFGELASATVTPAQNAALADYYRTRFGSVDGGRIDIDALLPAGNAAKYLQANYTLAAGDRDAAVTRADARDGSRWSQASARFNDYFREIVVGMQMRDLLLIDPGGTVVYSAYKDVDLGTNVLTGPYRGEGGLADVFRKAMATNEIGFAASTDFAEYLPAGEPTAWMVVPVGPPGRATGVLALQYPIRVINYLMTADRQWGLAGMGNTGETYLVGGDDLMRSDSRLFLEDREAYRRDVVKAGTPVETADRAVAQGTTVLVQPVGTRATDAAQRGETGTLIASDYLGHRALQAYAPLNLPGLDWIIIASIDSDEAFASERDFTQRLVRWTAIIILIACLAAMVWSRLFVRPIRRLEQGAAQISTGNYDLALPVESRDEFGDLAVAFNEMSRNLSIKQQLLDDQRRENDRVLRSLMPQQVVDRYRDGEETIAADHQDATVIFADLIGLDEISGDLAAEESLQIINKLARQFDSAAESLGVERVRSTHNGYLAACGLTVPRLDNIHRTVDFAVEMARIVDRFNAESGQDLRLRAGIDTGTVSSGLVGRAGLVYDLWGGAVHLASKLRHGASRPGVYVSEDVYEATRDTRNYEPAGDVVVDDDVSRPVWRLSDG